VIDLRGQTTLAEMLTLIKQYCSWLVVPDSGVLSLTYFLDCAFPLKIVSLWADPRQGILKQNVASPNPHLGHTPLIAPHGELSQVAVDQVMNALFGSPIHQRQRAVLARRHHLLSLTYSPLKDVAVSGSVEHFHIGTELIREGKVGAIILAGGQGTRLGYPGPKGIVPVSPVHRKSLFQLFAERVKQASREAGRSLKLGIMTSPLNHLETAQFFKDHDYFGLAEDQVDLFEQPLLPFCDDEGNWVQDGSGGVCTGPDGNGHLFHAFAASGLWQQWRVLGIEFVSVIPVDNPLADPFDAELIGFQHHAQADVVLKAVHRRAAHEKMGVVVSVEGGIRVIEYTELSSEDAEGTLADGSLTYSIANAGLFSFRADFIQKIVDLNVEMPLHLARKTTQINGEIIPVWKFETFIFDLLEYAVNPAVIVYPRDKVYSPLKNAYGEKSLETVRAALAESGIS
jgi:UDP-N-acetylglucosamine/UDP-N-acetylgalactosamine diphosphorylase